jgi:hypothetical protein
MVSAAGPSSASSRPAVSSRNRRSPEKMGDLFAGLQRSGAGSPGPTTLIGVAALASPDLLVEFVVTAVTT